MMKDNIFIGKRNWSNLFLKVDRSTFIIMIIGFSLGRVSILKNLVPFGYAFLFAYSFEKDQNIFLLLSTILGTLSLKGIGNLGYLLGYLSLYVIMSRNRAIKNYSLIKSSAIGSVIFLISRLLIYIFGKVYIYDIFMILFEAIMVFTMTYIFSYSFIFEEENLSNMSKEKAICTFITLALVISGFKDIGFLRFQIKNIISIVIILILSYGQGGLVGCSIGIILGLVTYISHPEMPFILSLFAVAGLLSGVFRDLGKSGSILGMFLGSGIVSYYINGFGFSFLKLGEIISASLIFLIIKDKHIKKISQLLYIELNTNKNHYERQNEIIMQKVNRVVGLFNSLSKTFKDSIKNDDYEITGQIYNMVDNIANDICVNCYKNRNCWENSYYVTYQNFYNTISIVDIKGVGDSRVYTELNKFCVKQKQILEKIDRIVERLKTNKIWKNKLNESRILLSEQLYGFGKLIDNISKDIFKKSNFNKDIEENIFIELKDKKIDINRVSVMDLGRGNLDIFIDLNTGVKDTNKIKLIISSLLGHGVVAESKDNMSNKRLRFKLLKTNRFSAITSTCKLSNSEGKVSGDSYTFGEMENNYYMAISDGMGIGHSAREESKTAISLLEGLMEINMDKDITIKTINSVLRTKSNGDIFTTLDLGFIDLYSGKFQMIKNGATATFIKKKNKTEIINSSSLPVGMFKEIDLDIYETYIESGDIIVMVSDGIIDAFKKDGVRIVSDLLDEMNTLNPQTIANELLRTAKGQTVSRDDMTILVTKVWKNIN